MAQAVNFCTLLSLKKLLILVVLVGFGRLSEQKCRFAISGKCLKGDNCEFSHEHAKDPGLAIVPFSRSYAPERVYMAAVSYSGGWTQEMEDLPFEECHDVDE